MKAHFQNLAAAVLGAVVLAAPFAFWMLGFPSAEFWIFLGKLFAVSLAASAVGILAGNVIAAGMGSGDE